MVPCFGRECEGGVAEAEEVMHELMGLVHERVACVLLWHGMERWCLAFGVLLSGICVLSSPYKQANGSVHRTSEDMYLKVKYHRFKDVFHVAEDIVTDLRSLL